MVYIHKRPSKALIEPATTGHPQRPVVRDPVAGPQGRGLITIGDPRTLGDNPVFPGIGSLNYWDLPSSRFSSMI